MQKQHNTNDRVEKAQVHHRGKSATKTQRGKGHRIKIKEIHKRKAITWTSISDKKTDRSTT